MKEKHTERQLKSRGNNMHKGGTDDNNPSPTSFRVIVLANCARLEINCSRILLLWLSSSSSFRFAVFHDGIRKRKKKKEKMEKSRNLAKNPRAHSHTIRQFHSWDQTQLQFADWEFIPILLPGGTLLRERSLLLAFTRELQLFHGKEPQTRILMQRLTVLPIRTIFLLWDS